VSCACQTWNQKKDRRERGDWTRIFFILIVGEDLAFEIYGDFATI
jgi:hypothetical protein